MVEGRPLIAYFLDRSTTSSTPGYNTRVYRPLRNIAFRALYVLGGARPSVFAAANVLSYWAAALLLLLLLARCGVPQRPALWATAIWIAAPVHVEAVTYASALGDVLSLALQLGAILAVVGAILRPTRSLGLVLGSLGLASLAMFTKEMAVTTPLLVGLACVLLPARAWSIRRCAVLIAAHALVALGYLATRTHVLGQVGQDPVTRAGMLEGLRSAPVRLIAYARLSLIPIGHTIDYVLPRPSTAAVLGALAALVALGWVVRRDRVLLLGLAWFVAALAPVLQLVPLSAELADRFALLPSVGLAIFAARGAGLLPPGGLRRLAPIFAGLVLVGYAAGTLLEARTWRSDGHLWRNAVLAEPRAPLAHRNLAGVLLSEGRNEAVLGELDTAEALGIVNAQTERIRALALLGLGRTEEAARVLERALLQRNVDADLELVEADVQRRLGAYDRADAAVVRARHDGVAQRSADLEEGLIALDRHDAHRAITIFARLVASWPHDPDFRGLLERACTAAVDEPDRRRCGRAP